MMDVKAKKSGECARMVLPNRKKVFIGTKMIKNWISGHCKYSYIFVKSFMLKFVKYLGESNYALFNPR